MPTLRNLTSFPPRNTFRSSPRCAPLALCRPHATAVLALVACACANDASSATDKTSAEAGVPTHPSAGVSIGTDNVELDAGEATETDPDDRTNLLAPGELNPDASEFSFDFERVVLDEEIPEVTDIQMLPSGNAFLALTKHGWLMQYEFDDAGARRIAAQELRRDGDPLIYSDDDCGGIGLATAPNFNDTLHVYLGGCVSRTHSALFRLEWHADDAEATMESLAQLLVVGEDSAERGWHNVGEVAFDSEGNLWTMFGEKTVASTARDTSNLLGTMVRIVPEAMSMDGQLGYEAASNPSLGGGARAEIYAYGLRSPWKGFQDNLGRYWIADVGASTVEEINIVTRGGEDYGWPDSEGPCSEDCSSVDPTLYWVHDDESGYLGDAPSSTRDGVGYAALQYQANESDPYEGHMDNRVIFGDYRGGFVRVAEVDEKQNVVFDHHVGHAINATGWMQAPDGFIYTARFRTADSIGDGIATLKRAVLSEVD